MKNILELKNITKDYQMGKICVHALRGVSIEIRKSDFISVIGPSGSGKSTLLNCLCGKPKAIVADIKGTTRDWVSAWCKIEPVAV